MHSGAQRQAGGGRKEDRDEKQQTETNPSTGLRRILPGDRLDNSPVFGNRQNHFADLGGRMTIHVSIFLAALWLFGAFMWGMAAGIFLGKFARGK